MEIVYRCAHIANKGSILVVLSFDNVLCLEFLERANLNELGKCVKRVLGIFILVSLSAQSYSYASGDILDTALPHVLVEGGINTHILGSHGLFGKRADFLHCARSTALKLHLVNPFGKVDCVIPSNNVLLGSHFYEFKEV